MVPAKDRIDGSLSPDVRLRPAMRCCMAVMTIDTRVPLFAASSIRTESDTITVFPNRTGLSLELPVALSIKVRHEGASDGPNGERMDQWIHRGGDL
jgi:hypothetical protein